MALEKSLDRIEEADLQSLIDNKVSERRTVEYKLKLPGNSDAERKEFLGDVSSLANASGGHLIYGMSASHGVPVGLLGLETDDPDGAILGLETSIRGGIAPRIGVHSREVGLANDKVAIVVRIPRSFAGPHMVTYKGTSRFFSRGSNGRYQLDVEQIRAAFLASETIAERIRDFRAERISRVLADETPVLLVAGAKVVLHLVPLNAFAREMPIDVADSEGTVGRFLWPIFHEGASRSHFNFEGIVCHSGPSDGPPSGYLQLYRNGCLESVDSWFLKPRSGQLILGPAFESRLIPRLGDYFQGFRKLGVRPPLLVMLSLLGVSGYRLLFSGAQGGYPIDRDHLLFTDVLIESFDCDLSAVLRPIFDCLSNAGGLPRWPNEGEFT